MISSSDFPEKSALRRALRARRAAVPPALRRVAGLRLIRHALRRRLLARKRRIGFYMPSKNEIDVLPLLDRARFMGVDCYLPIVPGRGHRKLWFIRLGDQAAWTVNRYGIPEYQHARARKVRATQLDIVFMPLLGFDDGGRRVGMGGGYYDASLARLGKRQVWPQPRRVGVAFASQQVDRIPNDVWDIPLSGILTERGYQAIKQAG